MLNISIQNTTKQYEHAMSLIDFSEQRKDKKSDRDTMWDKLNLSQQYSVCSLGQFGYMLTSVRTFAGKTLAVLKQNDKVAIINTAGLINMYPTMG